MTTEPNSNVRPIRSVEDLAKDLLDTQAAAAVLNERVAHLKGLIADQLGVGNSVTLDDAGGLTVSVRGPSRSFSAAKAEQLLAPEVLELCRADGYDAKKLKAFLSPLLLEQCMETGTGAPIVSVR